MTNRQMFWMIGFPASIWLWAQVPQSIVQMFHVLFKMATI
jgi:hypothetical protein